MKEWVWSIFDNQKKLSILKMATIHFDPIIAIGKFRHKKSLRKIFGTQ